MKTKPEYTAIVTWDPESRAYAVSVPALPGCHTWGRTIPEAIKNAKEAAQGYVEALAIVGDPIPVEVAQRTLSLR